MNPSGGETRLGDVIVENPKSTLKVRESISDGEFPFFSSGEVVSSFDKHICDGENLFIATGGKASVHYHDGKAAYSTDCFSITTRAILLPKFLFLFLESILPQIDEQMFEGAALRHLQKGRLRDTRMPLPPLPEQRRIVGILDEAFKYIAVAKANAQRNRQGGRALYDSHLHSVFSQRGSEWERLKLSTLLERGWIESHLDGNHGSNYPRKQEFVEDGVPYVSANCIDDERVDMSRAKYLSPARAGQLRKGIARHNDVLFAHNATVGPVAILRTSEPKVILSTSLTYYRCNPQRILPEYLAHYMRSFEFKTQYMQVMRQSTRNQVPITTQRDFFHVVPLLQEQERIIVALDGLFENSKRLDRIYRKKVAALEALRQSLLHRGVNGSLLNRP